MNVFRIVIPETMGSNETTQSFSFYIETNANSKEEIEYAYQKGIEKAGVDIQEILKSDDHSDYRKLLEAYEKIKPLISKGELEISMAQKLMDHYGRKDFAKDADIDDPEEYENDVIIDIPEYYLLWRAVARLGNPDLIINETDANLDIDIGGHREWFTS